MKATFALLFDHSVHNLVRKLAVEVHQTYQVGLGGSQLPPHVSLKQPFSIPDLPSIEAYFDQLVRSIDPLVLTFPRIGAPDDAPVLWLEVEESEPLRHLHTRINQELAQRFPNTQAPFDGLTYQFHLTIALGPPQSFGRGPLSSLYQSIATSLARREVALRATAEHLALFYYDTDQIELGTFLTYKILPQGKTNTGLTASPNG
jgi:2'-5' RNA ligase